MIKFLLEKFGAGLVKGHRQQKATKGHRQQKATGNNRPHNHISLSRQHNTRPQYNAAEVVITIQ